MLQAARERKLYAIGVDTNQNDLEPGHVVASNTKNVGKAIQDVFKTIVEKTYQPGAVIKYGIANGGVDLVTEAQVQVLPEDLKQRVFDLRKQIVEGKLPVALYDGSDVWR